MAQLVDDRCPNDREHLLSMGVNIKSRSHKVLDLAAEPRKDTMPITALSRSLGGVRVQVGVCVAVALSCLTLVLSVSALVFTFYVNNANASTMQELRDKIHTLETRCQHALPSPDDITPPDASPWKHEADSDVDGKARADLYQNWYDIRGYDDYDDDEDDDDGDGALEPDPFTERSRQKRSAKNKRKARSGKACKRVEKCIKENKNGKPVKKRCKKILACVPPAPSAPPAKPPSVPLAVHFMSRFWNNRRQERFGKETPLHFYQEADWMAKIYKDKSQQPIVPLKDGGYNVTQSGLYLIYSSVMFHDVKPRQSQAVVVNGEKRFKCMDSVDYIDKDNSDNDKRKVLAKYKTCAMTGVTHLSVGDRIEVQNLYAQTEIDLSTDATYFGAVLLSKGDINMTH